MNLLNWIFRNKQMLSTQNECNRRNFHYSGPILVMGFVIVIRNEWESFCCARAVARLSPNGICFVTTTAAPIGLSPSVEPQNCPLNDSKKAK